MRKFVFAVSVMFVFAASGLAQDAVQPVPAQKGIQTVNINDIREFDPKEILKKVPLAPDKMVFNTYFLEPRQLLKLHKHPSSDEIFFIVEGRGQFTVGRDQVMVDSGSAIYGPANVPHGLVNSGDKQIVMISIQAPKPVQIQYIDNASAACAVCGQENIIPEGSKEGDIITCPRCHAKLKLSKDKDGKWITTQL